MSDFVPRRGADKRADERDHGSPVLRDPDQADRAGIPVIQDSVQKIHPARHFPRRDRFRALPGPRGSAVPDHNTPAGDCEQLPRPFFIHLDVRGGIEPAPQNSISLLHGDPKGDLPAGQEEPAAARRVHDKANRVLLSDAKHSLLAAPNRHAVQQKAIMHLEIRSTKIDDSIVIGLNPALGRSRSPLPIWHGKGNVDRSIDTAPSLNKDSPVTHQNGPAVAVPRRQKSWKRHFLEKN